MSDRKFFVNSSSSYSQFLNLFRKNKATHELEEYEEQIGPGSHQLLNELRKKGDFHRLIFIGFFFLFSALAAVVYFKTTNWSCEMYFHNCELIKAIVISLCVLMACGAGGLAFSIKPERETARLLVEKVQGMLNQAYRQFQQMHEETGASKGSAPFTFSFKDRYHEAVERIEEKEEKTMQLLEWIAEARHLSHEAKEKLVNQALFDLDDKLKLIVRSFKDLPIAQTHYTFALEKEFLEAYSHQIEKN